MEYLVNLRLEIADRVLERLRSAISGGIDEIGEFGAVIDQVIDADVDQGQALTEESERAELTEIIGDCLEGLDNLGKANVAKALQAAQARIAQEQSFVVARRIVGRGVIG